MLTHTTPHRPDKPGPLLPTLLANMDLDLLARCRMADDGGQGDGKGGDGGNGGTGEPPKTFTQADLDRHIADRLARDRASRSDYDDLKKAAKELEDLKAAGATEQEKAIAKARKEAEDATRATVMSAANTRILKAEVKALAGARFADPTDALKMVDLTGLTVGDDGEVDEKAITKRLDDLLAAKPYLAAGTGTGSTAGSGLGGLGQGSRQPAGKVSAADKGRAEAAKRFPKPATQ